MIGKFLIWEWSRINHAVRLKTIENFTEWQYFVLGKSLAGKFPDNVYFRMDQNSPLDVVLTDNLKNINSLLVVSERLMTFLNQRKVKSVEYLPVTIFDQNDTPVKSKYFIVHTIDDIDCLDIAQAEPMYSEIRKESITLVKRMVFNETCIDPKRELFQVKNLDGFTFVTRDLAEAIIKANFTAVKWKAIADYNPYE